jgi:hypothetical protein
MVPGASTQIDATAAAAPTRIKRALPGRPVRFVARSQARRAQGQDARLSAKIKQISCKK